MKNARFIVVRAMMHASLTVWKNPLARDSISLYAQRNHSE
jgi:hypothetical protein